MPEKFTVRGEGLTVELVLHRKYGVRGRSLVEETMRINPGLADLGAFLPLGSSFTIPELKAQTSLARVRKSLFKD